MGLVNNVNMSIDKAQADIYALLFGTNPPPPTQKQAFSIGLPIIPLALIGIIIYYLVKK